MAKYYHLRVHFVACLEGFEPPTYWFVASHSIQLSYKHMSLRLKYYSTLFKCCQEQSDTICQNCMYCQNFNISCDSKCTKLYIFVKISFLT